MTPDPRQHPSPRHDRYPTGHHATPSLPDAERAIHAAPTSIIAAYLLQADAFWQSATPQEQQVIPAIRAVFAYELLRRRVELGERFVTVDGVRYEIAFCYSAIAKLRRI